jgi:hypothetical protein
VTGRDPALRQPAVGQQLPQVPGIGLVGLGMPLPAAGSRGVSRLADMRGASGRGQFLGDMPPPGAPLQGERDVVTAGEPCQPGPQVRAVSRGDLAAPDLPGHGVEIVERQLLPVDIQPAYDRHRDLLKLPRAPESARTRICLRSNRDASELGRSPHRRGTRSWLHHAQPLTAGQPMHVIYTSVDSCREPDSAGLRWTTPAADSSAREPENAQATGRFRWWWQVLGSNQRRLSRRFYRPFPVAL